MLVQAGPASLERIDVAQQVALEGALVVASGGARAGDDAGHLERQLLGGRQAVDAADDPQPPVHPELGVCHPLLFAAQAIDCQRFVLAFDLDGRQFVKGQVGARGLID